MFSQSIRKIMRNAKINIVITGHGVLQSLRNSHLNPLTIMHSLFDLQKCIHTKMSTIYYDQLIKI